MFWRATDNARRTKSLPAGRVLPARLGGDGHRRVRVGAVEVQPPSVEAMARRNYLVLLESAGQWYKLCRIIFGTDGSYYVTSPYREGSGAVLFKATVNYAKASMSVALEELIDLASVEDEQRAVKLSHHPDGLVQFSGPNVTSGRDEQGNPLGMAVQSWLLDKPVA